MSNFIPRNEDEAEAYKSFRETGSPAGLNAIGLVVKIAKVSTAGAIVYEIVRNAPKVIETAANFINNH